ncbi:hypothetical protein [Mesorhizobium sp. NZP2298]|uniref:hypothetical protein n=1 Tax=Mesorhizobium sp. NZP2298 TaxID=2483403 RepID=UPI001555A682|nr:hypothetical protein [Mesorhizobium sp. NZP2298]QKC96078.1 hypothetical protein EB231_16285 [Mesorhizobium sp. NZP2298]
MTKKIALFQDITLGYDGSAGLRYLKGVIDDDGNSLGGMEPHRLAIQPDCDDVAGLVRWQNGVLLDAMGFEVEDGYALADFVASAVSHHREDPTIAAKTRAWCDAAEAKRLARVAEEEERARQQAEQAAAEEQAAQEAEAARQSEVQAMIDSAVATALAGRG